MIRRARAHEGPDETGKEWWTSSGDTRTLTPPPEVAEHGRQWFCVGKRRGGRMGRSWGDFVCSNETPMSHPQDTPLSTAHTSHVHPSAPHTHAHRSSNQSSLSRFNQLRATSSLAHATLPARVAGENAGVVAYASPAAASMAAAASIAGVLSGNSGSASRAAQSASELPSG